MFLRKSGRQCLLLSSYRDAQGRVRQRRLGSFRDVASLERELHRLVPPDRLAPMRATARQILEQLPRPKTSVREATRRTAQALLNLLSQRPELDDTEEVQRLRERLQSPCSQSPSQRERVRLSPRRRHYWAQDAAVQAYTQALDGEALELKQQHRLEASLKLYQQRLALTRGDRTPLQVAQILHQLGRLEEARDVVAHMPPGDPWREYHLATLHWQLQQPTQAMKHFDRALTLAPEIAEGLPDPGKAPSQAYWRDYLELWDLPSRRVLADLAQLPVIRGERRRARDLGRTPRRLIPVVAQGWILDRAQRIAAGFDPGRRQGRLDASPYIRSSVGEVGDYQRQSQTCDGSDGTKDDCPAQRGSC